MAFDLAAYRSYFRFLVGDPNGYTFTNLQVRDNYINPTYQEWWHRHERRPGNFVAFAVDGSSYLWPITQGGEMVEHVTRQVSASEEAGLLRDEFNRLRYLQESEGAIGPPELWAAVKIDDFFTYLTFYPIPDTSYAINYYGQADGSPLLLSADGNCMVIDPVSAHMVVRLAAYRAAVDMHRATPRLKAILQPVPAWIRLRWNAQWLFEDKPYPKELSPLYTEEPTRA